MDVIDLRQSVYASMLTIYFLTLPFGIFEMNRTKIKIDSILKAYCKLFSIHFAKEDKILGLTYFTVLWRPLTRYYFKVKKRYINTF